MALLLTTTTLPGLLTKPPGLSPYSRPLDSVPSNLKVKNVSNGENNTWQKKTGDPKNGSCKLRQTTQHTANKLKNYTQVT